MNNVHICWSVLPVSERGKSWLSYSGHHEMAHNNVVYGLSLSLCWSFLLEEYLRTTVWLGELSLHLSDSSLTSKFSFVPAIALNLHHDHTTSKSTNQFLTNSHMIPEASNQNWPDITGLGCHGSRCMHACETVFHWLSEVEQDCINSVW